MSDELEIPFKSDVMPAKLELGSELRFRCHKGISCFNACCKQADITLTPYDILRLKDRLGKSFSEFIKDHTVPFQMDQDGVPGIKLRTDNDGACLFVTEEGCSVYPDRPTSCRYYPLGHMAMRKAGVSEEETHYFLVKEDHCKGHEEDQVLTVQEYLHDQETGLYDQMNKEWLQILLKKRSAGPSVGRPSETSLQFFFMASYNLDNFRAFVMSENFRNTYELDDATYAALEKEDQALLQFANKMMRQVLFGEKSIPEKEGVWDKRLEGRKEVWEARRQAEIARKQAEQDDMYDNT